MQITAFWCHPKGPYNKVSVCQSVSGARTVLRRGLSGPPSSVEAKLRPWGKNTTSTNSFCVASATSRPCQRAVAVVSATLMLAGVRLFNPALNPIGNRMSIVKLGSQLVQLSSGQVLFQSRAQSLASQHLGSSDLLHP